MCKQLESKSTSAEPSATKPVTAPAAPAAPAINPGTPGASKAGMKKSVSFQSVEIAQYPVELGDNPSADGLPLSLGWECDSRSKFELDEYETAKPEARTRHEFWMPASYRADMLRRQGVTASEMLRTTKEMKKIQKSRNRSIENQKWDKVHLFMEQSGRKLKKVTSATSLKRVSSSSSLLSSHTADTRSSSTSSLSSLSKLLPKSTKSSPRLGGAGKKSRASCDALDDSRSRMAVHLLQHPEDIVIHNEEAPTEELSDINTESLSIQAVVYRCT